MNSNNNNTENSLKDSIMSRESKADDMVQNHVLSSVALGVLPIPMIDFIALSVIQCHMLKGLCEIYGHAYSENQIKSWVSSIVGGYTSTFIGSRLLLGLLKGVPGVGLATGASGGAMTYALSLIFRRHFANGGSPETVDIEVMESQFKTDLQTAKQQVKEPEVKESVVNKVKSSKKRDLTFIEGVGPKTRDLLAEHNIISFKQLAEADIAQLRDILNEAGARFNACDPRTWPEQAKLAEQGEWQALEALKQTLKGGRRK